MEELSYHHSRKETLSLVLSSFVMFGISLYLLYLGLFTDFTIQLMGSATGPISIFVGSIGSLFFGYAFYFILRRALFPENALIITDKGIIDNTNAIGTKELIPFKNMKKAKLELISGIPNIGIELYNDEQYFEKLPFIKRKAQEINKKFFGSSTVSMTVPHDSREELHEIIDIINERIEITKTRTEMKW